MLLGIEFSQARVWPVVVASVSCIHFSLGNYLQILSVGSREDEPTCGRPLGIRVGPNNTLFVADAYYGLYEVHPDTGMTFLFRNSLPLPKLDVVCRFARHCRLNSACLLCTVCWSCLDETWHTGACYLCSCSNYFLSLSVSWLSVPCFLVTYTFGCQNECLRICG